MVVVSGVSDFGSLAEFNLFEDYFLREYDRDTWIAESNSSTNEQEVQEKANSSVGYGIAALIFGIISIVSLCFIIISILSAVLAIIFGFIAMKKGDKLGKAGLILGIISIVITFLLFLFLQVLDVSLFVIPSWYK